MVRERDVDAFGSLAWRGGIGSKLDLSATAISSGGVCVCSKVVHNIVIVWSDDVRLHNNTHFSLIYIFLILIYTALKSSMSTGGECPQEPSAGFLMKLTKLPCS